MRKFLLLIKISASIGLIFWLFSKVDLTLVWHQISNAEMSFVLLALTLLICQNFVSAVKWMAAGKIFGADLSWREYLASIHIAGLINQVVPSSFGGDLYRFFRFKPVLKAKKLVGALAVDRLMIHVAWIFLLFLSVPFLSEELSQVFGEWLTIAAILGVLFIGSFIAYIWRSRKLNKLWVLYRRGMLMQLFWNILVCLFVPLTIGVCLNAMGQGVSYSTLMLRSPILLAILALPISFANWGSRELAVLFLYSDLGMDQSDLLSASILYGVLTLVSFSPGLPLYLLRKKLESANMERKSIEKEKVTSMVPRAKGAKFQGPV